MRDKQYYYRIVTSPIKDYGFNLKVGDYIDEPAILYLPPYYRKNCTKLLPSPVLKQSK